MELVSELNVDLFSGPVPAWDQIRQLTRKVHSNARELDRFTQQVEEYQNKTSAEDRLRAGIGLYMLGRFIPARENRTYSSWARSNSDSDPDLRNFRIEVSYSGHDANGFEFSGRMRAKFLPNSE